MCDLAGLSTEHVLAWDAPLPHDLNLAFAVATDDLMVFSDSGAGRTLKAARDVEAVMLEQGIVKQARKGR